MKFLAFFPLLGVSWAQTCAPPGSLRPSDSVQSTLDANNCQLSDGTLYADYLVTFPVHGSVSLQAASSDTGVSILLRDSGGHKLASGASITSPVEAGDYHVLVNATAPGQTGAFTLTSKFSPEPGALCRAFSRIAVPPAGIAQSFVGRLDGSSCQLPDGSAYDAYRMPVYGAGTLTVTVEATGFAPLAILRGADGALLGSADNGGQGSTASLPVPVLGGDTYEIVIAAASSSQPAGAYKLSVSFVSDPDETCRASQVFKNSGSTDGTVGPGSCSFNLPDRTGFSYFNYYDLLIAAPGVAQIQIQNANFPPLLLLFDKNGNPVGQDSQSGGANSPYIRQQLAPGNYRLLVFSEDTTGGNYSLSYMFNPGLPDICPVLSLAPATMLSGALSGDSSCRSDDLLADVYRLVLDQSGTLDLTVSSGDFGAAIELLDAKDNVLREGQTIADGSGARLTADLPAGTYAVAAASLDRPGGYNIAYQFTPKDLAPCATVQNVALNGGFIGSLGPASCAGSTDGAPVDYYQFTTPADGTVAAFMTSRVVDSLLTLFDAQGNRLRSDSTSYLDNSAAIEQYLPAGSYRIAAQSSGTSTGPYRVDVLFSPGDRPPFCSARPITTNSTTAGRLDYPSCQYPDNTFADIYSITIPDGFAGLDVQLNSADFDGYLLLLDGKGNVVARDDNSGGGTNAHIVQPLDAGIYFIVVKPAEDPSSSGNYTLTVQ